MYRTLNAVDHSMPALTGLRGLAAIWVLLYHAWVYATPREILLEVLGVEIRLHVVFSLGWAGVQVLFVLSAFLLTLPYARANAGLRSRPAVWSYLKRRVARVFPAFHIQLLILVCLSLILIGSLPMDLSELPRYLLMLFVPPPVGVGSPSSINGVWWTLPIELSFYLVLPLLSVLASWQRKWWLLGLSLLSMVGWRYFITAQVQPDADLPMWVYQLPGAMDSFAAGMLGAILHVHFTELATGQLVYRRVLKGLLWLSPIMLIALGMWLDAYYLDYWQPGPLLFCWTTLFSLTMLVILLNGAIAERGSWLSIVLANPVIYFMGTVSYGLYLWHYPVGDWLRAAPFIADMPGYQFPRLALMMLALATIAATLSWFLVEKHAIAGVRRNQQ